MCMDPLIRVIRVIVVQWFSYISRAYHENLAFQGDEAPQAGPVDEVAAIASPSPIRFHHRKAVQYDPFRHSYHSAPAASVTGRNRSEAG